MHQRIRHDEFESKEERLWSISNVRLEESPEPQKFRGTIVVFIQNLSPDYRQ
jgi:hypothetical protein